MVELLVAVAIIGIIASATIALVSACLAVHQEGTARAQLSAEGLRAMARITESVRRSTYVGVPNARRRTRDLLVLSGFVNDDDDHYFDDPLFPRIDEDSGGDMNQDNRQGVAGVDDNGNGSADEGGASLRFDDDEDGATDEDPLDGQDNDGDGNIDEDPPGDMRGDNGPGIVAIDDDGDGDVDEWDWEDDDEDGLVDEDGGNEKIIRITSGTQLREENPSGPMNAALADHATFFQVTWLDPGLFLVELELTGDGGEIVRFGEYAYARNARQRCGKRVR
jgi:hypothetical protein